MYKLTKDWASNLYCSITLEWDYVNRTINISMLGYIKKKLQEYEHVMAKRLQTCPTHLSLNNSAQRHRPHSHQTTHHDSTLREENMSKNSWEHFVLCTCR